MGLIVRQDPTGPAAFRSGTPLLSILSSGLLRIWLGLLLTSAGVALAQQYTISTVAGGAPPPTPAEATAIGIGSTLGVATDSAGNVYFSARNVVLKVDT